MNLAPAKARPQPKQLAILGILVIVLGVVYWTNRTPSASEVSVAPTSAPSVLNPLGPRPAPSGPMPTQRASGRGERVMEDFRPSLKLKEGVDVTRIDPTLKLDLLAKVRNVPREGGSRSLFEFSQPPAPPQPKVTIKPGPEVAAAKPPESGTPPAPANPAPPPTPLKFYGYVGGPQSGVRRAFFLDGDDIFVAGENDMIRNRYKIIRIGVNSAVVEDTSNKNQQTLQLVEELPA